MPLRYDDINGVTACAFNENYLAFATSCTTGTSLDETLTLHSDSDDDDDVSFKKFGKVLDFIFMTKLGLLNHGN